tara:strand:- start:26798 stop:27061 length:264 start_codon:yes stop_codon:yes gene_type:complete
MILPHPETDFSTNILVVATDIIKYLQMQKKPILLEKVMESFLKKDIRRTPDLFIKCLTFLYSFGLIEYSNYKIALISKKSNIQQNLF